MIYNICQQIIFAHLAIFELGFFHNDMHSENILITQTGNDKTLTAKFSIIHGEALTINVFGPQITVIDFGQASEIAGRKNAKRNKKLLLNEIVYSLMYFLQTHASANGMHILGTNTISPITNINAKILQDVAAHHPEILDLVEKQLRAQNIHVDAVLDKVRRNDLEFSQTTDMQDIRTVVIEIRHQFAAQHPNAYKSLLEIYEIQTNHVFCIPVTHVRRLLQCNTIANLITWSQHKP